MIRLFPDLDEDLLLNLFHKGAKIQWTSRDVDWDDRLELTEAQCGSLANILTPVYLGEQSAMLGASSVIPQLAQNGETTAQIYLASFMMDEARHFEALTHLYHRLGQQPIGIKRMPEMLRYHHRLRQGDRADWVWGILISDLFAKNFYQIFSKSQPEALFGKMSKRILQDESRHQAFADHYLSRAIPKMTEERREHLRASWHDLLRIMGQMYSRLSEDTDRLGIDGTDFLGRLEADIELHAKRIGLLPDGGGGGGGRRPLIAKTVDLDSRRQVHRRVQPPAPGTPRLTDAAEDCGQSCDECYLSVICQALARRAVAK